MVPAFWRAIQEASSESGETLELPVLAQDLRLVEAEQAGNLPTVLSCSAWHGGCLYSPP
jgi:hypothetical protein